MSAAPTVPLAVRVHPDHRDALDRAAVRAGRALSDEVRAQLAYAARHMPAGWTPPTTTQESP